MHGRVVAPPFDRPNRKCCSTLHLWWELRQESCNWTAHLAPVVGATAIAPVVGATAIAPVVGATAIAPVVGATAGPCDSLINHLLMLTLI